MRILLLAPTALLAGCITLGGTKVATDVQVVEKPVSVGCTIDWPAPPVPHVANVQLTGEARRDLVLIERAMEAELEERIAYEEKLKAAAKACAQDPAPADRAGRP